jgi:hypothetical protein
MKLRLVGTLAIAVLLPAIALVGVGCGDGEGLTLEEYFQEVVSIRDDAQDRLATLMDELTADVAPDASEEEVMQVTIDMMSQGMPITAELVDKLKDLDPPAAVEDAHSELVEAGDDSVEALEDFVEQAADAESMSEVNELLGGEVMAAAEARADEACVVLQGIADDNGIDVDLECQE